MPLQQPHTLPCQDPLRLGSGAVDHPRLDTVATAPIDEAASRLRERPCRGSLSHGYVNEDLPKSKKLPLDQQQRYHRRREKLLLRGDAIARKTEELFMDEEELKTYYDIINIWNAKHFDKSNCWGVPDAYYDDDVDFVHVFNLAPRITCRWV